MNDKHLGMFKGIVMDEVQAKARAVEVAKEQAGEVQAARFYVNLFMPLLPQLSLFRTAHGYEVEGGLKEEATPERIAAEADAIAVAGVERLMSRLRVGGG
jgi:hypothetical protein